MSTHDRPQVPAHEPRKVELRDEDFGSANRRSGLKNILIAAATFCLAVQAGPSVGLAQPEPAGSHPLICLEAGEAQLGPLDTRIGEPDPEIIEIFAGAGASDISLHELTQEEQALVSRVLSRLPALHRDVLQRHLQQLSFLDLKPGAGSALTSRVGLDETSTQFDITLRANLLDESLTTFLNTKEARLFEDDGSGFSIEFDAGETDALTYILLHEASHIVDLVMGLTDDDEGPFRAGIWDGARSIAAPYASSLAAKSPFRGQEPIPLAQSPDFYESLRQSPFLSSYATAAASEDLAELFAWQQLESRLEQSLALVRRQVI